MTLPRHILSVTFRLPNQNAIVALQGKEAQTEWIMAPFWADEQADQSGEIDQHLSQVQYINLVAKAVADIQEGKLDKVVVARSKAMHIPSDASPESTFSKMCEAYPSAFVAHVQLDNGEHWLGASPELLLGYDGISQIKTMALAGTLPASEQLFSDKLLEENLIVAEYIEQWARANGLKLAFKEGPIAISAAHLQHLCYHYSFEVVKELAAKSGLLHHWLQTLHPTPAVAGYSTAAALEWIRHNEPTRRSFYAGYWGPKNYATGAAQLFVNLRCMRWTSSAITLYAGAGIVRDSNPQAEWEETQRKMQVVRSILEPHSASN